MSHPTLQQVPGSRRLTDAATETSSRRGGEPDDDRGDVGQGPNDVDADAALAALNDEGCRCILVAAEREPRTARELSESCDLPMSTAYRKLELLTTASLLEERLRIRPDGNHVSEYASRSLSVRLGLSADGVEVSLGSPGDAGQPQPAD